MVTHYNNALRIAKVVRERNPETLIVGGGPLPTLFPESYNEHYDAIFRGEVDLSFPRFCQDYFHGNATRDTLYGLPLGTYEGLYISTDELGLSNETKHYPEIEIQSFPIPDRTQFDHQLYQEAWLEKDGTKTTSIITTLGCPFNCDFCSKPIFGSLFRHRNLDAVFEEIQQIRNLGYDSLWVADDTFTLDISFLEQFCQRIACEGIRWTCLSRCNGIDESITRMMKDAGCQRVYLGLESGSQRILELMNKKFRLEEGINAVYQFRKAGIEVSGFFIVGYPGETIESIEETCKLSLSLPLDSISFNVPFPLPGSGLFERVGKSGKLRDWKLENEVTFVYQSKFDDQWIRSRIEQTMEAFLEKRGRTISSKRR